VIGPEGGLTDDELAALDRAGAHRVRLAGPILRIETAALAAAAVWASAWEHAAP
jgi:16S rRNA (uracil1498-N3)-methyltransferase